MSCKKLLVVPLVAGLVFGSVTTVKEAYAGPVNQACYATTKCGAKSGLKWAGMYVGSQVGTVAGIVGGTGLTFWTGNPVAVAFGAGAGAVVGFQAGFKLGGKLGTAAGKKYSANEYIYFDDDTCLECDTHQIGEDYECANGSIVTNGAETYRCHTATTGDYWEKYKIPVCSDSPVKNGNDKGYYKVTYKDNITNNGKRVHDGVYVFSNSVCLYIEEVKVDPKPDPKPTPTPDPKQKDCKAKRAQYGLEAMACCDVPSASSWFDATNKKCICTSDTKNHTPDPTKEFKIVNDKGYCVDKGTNPVDPVPPVDPGQPCSCTVVWSAINAYSEVMASTNIKLRNCVSLSVDSLAAAGVSISSLRSVCASAAAICSVTNVSAVNINNYVSQVIQIIDTCKANDGNTQPVPPVQNPDPVIDEKAVADAVEAIDKFKATLDVSVWKDAEGNFNTARLVSDGAAAVVLGTAGGLITSSVVKKNQLKKGFEDIVCTVGGQVVGSYGDEITVGVR